MYVVTRSLLGLWILAMVSLYFITLKWFHGFQYGKQHPCLIYMLRSEGRLGEFKLGWELEKAIPDCKLLFNVYIPKGDGTYSECDCVMFYQGHVYVLESKNYSGWIFGNAQEKYWTQALNERTKNKFYNPIRQNAGHVRALASFTGMKPSSFTPIVVFSDRCTFKALKGCGGTSVMHRSQVPSFILEASEHSTNRVNTEELYKKLYPCTQVSKKVKEEHRNRVKRYAAS